MSEPKFTSGPWRIAEISISDDNDRLVSKRGIYAGRNVLPIAYVTGDRRGAAESDANAHLIAAAPELIASLKRMLEVYWGEGDGHEPAPQFIIDAQSAAAKAEGRIP